jgi:hypothetical protein
MKIKDNFLAKKDLTELDNLVGTSFPWYLQQEMVEGANDGYFFSHIIYNEDVPGSDLYDPIIKIFKNYLNYVSLIRINVNLLLRQETPSISDFHTDFHTDYDGEKITTAIFYLNTNNGATEFKDGDRIDSVRNRLIIFPTNTLHRAIGQTDVATRIVFNFNFIKRENK